MIEIELTEAGRSWLQDHYPQGIIWECDIEVE